MSTRISQTGIDTRPAAHGQFQTGRCGSQHVPGLGRTPRRSGRYQAPGIAGPHARTAGQFQVGNDRTRAESWWRHRTPLRGRAASSPCVEHEVKPLFARSFEAHPQVRSILLCVGQCGRRGRRRRAQARLHASQDSQSGTTGDGDLCSPCAWDRRPGSPRGGASVSTRATDRSAERRPRWRGCQARTATPDTSGAGDVRAISCACGHGCGCGYRRARLRGVA